MTPAAAQADAVCFAPSKVVGMPGVEEVAVYPDRLVFHAQGQRREIIFETIAQWPESRLGARIKRRLGMRPYRGLVAHLVYVREPYEESYFEFFTEPRVRVHMPAGGPALSPHSHFWRVQEVLRRGGYAADDPDYAGERERVRLRQRPRALRLAGRVLIAVAVVNWALLFASDVWLGGSARFGEVRDGRYYVAGRPGRSHAEMREVSPQAWHFSLAIGRVALPSPVLLFAGVVMLYGFPWEWTGRYGGGAHRSVSYGRPK